MPLITRDGKVAPSIPPPLAANPDPASTSSGGAHAAGRRVYKPLILLSAGAFAIGTSNFVVAGILPAIASDLRISAAAAGQLVAMFALAYAIGSPIMAVVTSGRRRKAVVVAALSGFAVATFAAAAAPSYAVLAGARVLQALAAGTFMPTASAYAASLAPARQKGRALSAILAGLTMATLIGVPIGTIIGAEIGWRMTFAAIAGVAGLVTIGIGALLSELPPSEEFPLTERLAIARRGAVLAVLLVTMLGTTGAFTVYTYIALFLARAAGFTGPTIASVLLVFGLGGAIGNLCGGVACDRWGPLPVLRIVLLTLAAAFVTLSLAAETLDRASAGLVASAAIGIWGTFGWSFQAAQQMRLVSIEPNQSAIALSLNTSATYLAIAMGATLGGLLVAHGEVTAIGWVGAACQLLGLTALQLWRGTARTGGGRPPTASDGAGEPQSRRFVERNDRFGTAARPARRFPARSALP